jgi:hypothetical protein
MAATGNLSQRSDPGHVRGGKRREKNAVWFGGSRAYAATQIGCTNQEGQRVEVDMRRGMSEISLLGLDKGSSHALQAGLFQLRQVQNGVTGSGLDAGI